MLQAQDFIAFAKTQKEKFARVNAQSFVLQKNLINQQIDMWLDSILTRVLLCASIRDCEYVDFRIKLGVEGEIPVQDEDYHPLAIVTDKTMKEFGLIVGMSYNDDFPSVSEQIQILREAFCSNYSALEKMFTEKKYKTEKRRLGLGTKFYLRVYLNQTL